MTPRASLDLGVGHVQFAGRRVAVRFLGALGQLQIGDDDGPVLRAPTFGERSRLIATALGTVDPALALAAALTTVLRVRAGRCDTTTEHVVALLLSGAGEPGPPLVETACLVARAAASPLHSIEALDAVQIDLYARGLAADAEPDDGWHRVVLAAPAALNVDADATSADEAAIVQELAEVLLDRARARGSATLRDVAGNTGTASRPVDHSQATPAGWADAAHASSSGANLAPDAAPDEKRPSPLTRPSAPASPAPTSSLEHAQPSREPQPETIQGTFQVPEEPTNAPDTAPDPARRPLLRFRHPVAPSDPPHRSLAATPLAPAHVALERTNARPHPTASPSAWEQTAWRLARPASAAASASNDPGAREFASFGTMTLPDGCVTPIIARPTNFARSADEFADLVAESLQREAARRGLVP